MISHMGWPRPAPNPRPSPNNIMLFMHYWTVMHKNKQHESTLTSNFKMELNLNCSPTTLSHYKPL